MNAKITALDRFIDLYNHAQNSNDRAGWIKAAKRILTTREYALFIAALGIKE